jgi:hypothetical protein
VCLFVCLFIFVDPDAIWFCATRVWDTF